MLQARWKNKAVSTFLESSAGPHTNKGHAVALQLSLFYSHVNKLTVNAAQVNQLQKKKKTSVVRQDVSAVSI